MPDDRTKRYFWLRLHRDFFKRHDMRIIESMPNGKDYLLFYLKLLCESVDHDGDLRFSDTIPYDDHMLAAITDTNVDIVRSAVKVFVELDLMQRLDDGTLHLEQAQKLTGSITNWAEKKRVYREQQRQIADERTSSGHVRQEIEIEIEKEREDRSPKSRTRYDNLVADYGKAVVDDYVQRVKDYSAAKGKRYKDHAAAAANWLKRDGVAKRVGAGPRASPAPTVCECGGKVRSTHDEALCGECGKEWWLSGGEWVKGE